jgi:dTDP-4-dehydrorhamnose 3,5-epimerase|tara:strand:- start:2134 stop:2646 length:513 start_codon:yes stop_codon:yes gene_type:complete
MKVEETDLDGVLLITPPTIFKDFRGEYVETYNKELYFEKGIDTDFIQDDISVSKKNVLRGIHGDQSTTKLISCLSGSFFLVVVNNDPSSKQFKQSVSFILSESNRLQVLVPEKFGNGHLVLSEQAIFHYKQNTQYNRSGQFTILWNDPDYNFEWPNNNPILSVRDSGKDS